MDSGFFREDDLLDILTLARHAFYLGTMNDGVERLFGEDAEVRVFIDIHKLNLAAENVLTEGVILCEEFLCNLCAKLLIFLHLKKVF